MIETNCDLCGSDQHSLLHEVEVTLDNPRYYRYAKHVPNSDKMTGKFSIVRCNNCSLVFTNPRFEAEELALVYSSDKILGGNWKNFWYLFDAKQPDSFSKDGKGKVKSYSTELYQWKFDIIEQHTSSEKGPLQLLDIGCGDGKFVYDALQRGYEATGIDLSPDRVAKGKSIYGLDDRQIRNINVDDFSPDEKFDIIVMWDVIEHVESPAALLKKLRRISHEKTMVFLLTMSLDSMTYRRFGKEWNYINPPQHLFYFSHETMGKMLDKVGFDLVAVEMDDSKETGCHQFIARVIIGRINRFFLSLYTKEKPLRGLFKFLQGSISDERMKERAENLYPGIYLGRYHDNFVFVAKPKHNPGGQN